MTRRAPGRATRKIFHKIGEVCELTKTEPYVLRYWESEFPFLAPEKNKAGQRIYSDEDIQTVLAIKRLLYEEGYTTAGARRRLEKEREDGGVAVESAPAPAAEPAAAAPRAAEAAASAGAVSADVRDALRQVRDGLVEIRALLSPGARDEEPSETVERGARPRRPRR